MFDIYITGSYNNYKMQYAGVAISSAPLPPSFGTFCVAGEVTGSKPEAEMEAVKNALQFAFPYSVPVTIHTDFEGIKARVDGKIKSASQSAKALMALITTVKSKASLDVVENIPLREQKVLDYLVKHCKDLKTPNGELVPSGQWRTCEIRWTKPSFRVTARDRNGKVLCDLNEEFFGGVIAEAIQFVRWCERESKNENGYWYGITVEYQNLPI